MQLEFFCLFLVIAGLALVVDAAPRRSPRSLFSRLSKGRLAVGAASQPRARTSSTRFGDSSSQRPSSVSEAYIYTRDAENRLSRELTSALSRVESSIKELEVEVKDGMKELEVELKDGMKELKTELKGDIKELKNDMKDLKGDFFKYGGAVSLALLFVSLSTQPETREAFKSFIEFIKLNFA
jgi:hypothetical protein